MFIRWAISQDTKLSVFHKIILQKTEAATLHLNPEQSHSYSYYGTLSTTISYSEKANGYLDETIIWKKISTMFNFDAFKVKAKECNTGLVTEDMTFNCKW